MKDKSANERFAYNQQILRTETAIEALQENKRKIDQLLESYEMEMTEQFRRLQSLQEEMIAEGSVKEKWAELDRQQEHQYLLRSITEHRERLHQTWQTSLTSLDEERAQLLRKRDALPWEESTIDSEDETNH